MKPDAKTVQMHFRLHDTHEIVHSFDVPATLNGTDFDRVVNGALRNMDSERCFLDFSELLEAQFVADAKEPSDAEA